MIKVCNNCGGLYATENMESFAGKPCICGAKHPTMTTEPTRWGTFKEREGTLTFFRGDGETTEEYSVPSELVHNLILSERREAQIEVLNFLEKCGHTDTCNYPELIKAAREENERG